MNATTANLATRLAAIESRANFLQAQVGGWSLANFGEQRSKVNPSLVLGSLNPLMGIGEELGEIEGAIQSKNHRETLDGFADVVIYLCDYCEREKLSLGGIIFGSLVGRSEVQLLKNLFGQDGFRDYGKLLHATLKHHQGIRGLDDLATYRALLEATLKDFFFSLLVHFEGFALDTGSFYNEETVLKEIVDAYEAHEDKRATRQLEAITEEPDELLDLTRQFQEKWSEDDIVAGDLVCSFLAAELLLLPDGRMFAAI